MNKNGNKPILDKEVKELISQLKEMCYMKRIPMFMAFVESNSEETTNYVYEILTGNTCDMTLADDKLIDFSNVINGARVIFESDLDSIDTDEFFGTVVPLDELPDMFVQEN